MPTYEYACTSCGEHLEVVQSFSDKPLATCPNCQGPLRKVFGSIGIVLKGSGFYKTDNRSSRNGAAPAKSETGSTSESAGSGTSAGSGSSAGSGGSGSSEGASSGSGTSSSSPAPAAKVAAS